MAGEKAQVSVEYLVITSFLLIFIAIVFAYSLVNLNENAKLSRANDTVKALANAADQVSAFSSGSTIYIHIAVPNDVYSAYAKNHEIKYVMDVVGGQSEAWETTKAPITPTALPTSPGLYEMKIEILDGNVVMTQV